MEGVLLCHWQLVMVYAFVDCELALRIQEIPGAVSLRHCGGAVGASLAGQVHAVGDVMMPVG